MNQKSFILKFITIPLFTLVVSQFTACGDNPIEAENKQQEKLSINVRSALASLARLRENTDYYTCYNKAKRFVGNYKKRCDTFIDKFMGDGADSVLNLATVIKMVKDEDNYNDIRSSSLGKTAAFAQKCSWRAGAFLAGKMRDNEFSDIKPCT